MYIHSFFSAPLSSLIMNHLWLSSHDEYSETQSDNGYYLQVIPLYRSVLLSKCTSIHSSLHPCLPLIWIISDCLFMMSIRRHTQTTATTYCKSFHCTECVLLSSMYISCSFFSAPLSSLIMNHLWLSSHDEYSEIHEDPNLLITSHSTVHK